jgi:hypothetical protein
MNIWIDWKAEQFVDLRHFFYYKEPFEDAKLAGWNGEGWYYWDETQSYCHGPFKDLSEANKHREKYIKHLNNYRNLDKKK